jgi:uncharacterized protein
VVDVDVPRKRIGLTCRLDDAALRTARGDRDTARPEAPKGRPPQDRGRAQAQKAQPAFANNALADAFAKAKQK